MLDGELSASEKYIILALAADKLLKDRPVVFHYYGPQALKRRAGALKNRGLDAVVRETRKLEDEVFKTFDDVHPFFRRTYLISQIRSLRGLLELKDIKLTGKKLIDAVSNILGIIPPQPYDITKIKVENKAMPERANEFEFKITDKTIRSWIDYLKACFKKDVMPHIFHSEEMANFVNRSTITLARPKEGYPPCYYIYRGEGRAIVHLSDSHKKDKNTAIRTLMHELCPGHHIYYLYREMLFNLGLLGEEATVDLIYSSETPISEGIAESALFYLDSIDPELLKQIKTETLSEQFRKKVLYNVWYYRFVEGSMSDEDSCSYLVEEGHFEKERVNTWLNFIDEWRIYYPSYPVGTDRIRKYLNGGNKSNLFYFYIPKSIPVLDKIEAHGANWLCRSKRKEER